MKIAPIFVRNNYCACFILLKSVKYTYFLIQVNQHKLYEAIKILITRITLVVGVGVLLSEVSRTTCCERDKMQNKKEAINAGSGECSPDSFPSVRCTCTEDGTTGCNSVKQSE